MVRGSEEGDGKGKEEERGRKKKEKEREREREREERVFVKRLNRFSCCLASPRLN
jgi:hypothetical protein